MSLYLNGNKIVNGFVVDGSSSIVPSGILNHGQVSTTSAYATAYFSDISAYKYVFVKVYRDDTVYANKTVIKVSDIPASGELTFSLALHVSVSFAITRTSISSYYYQGAYYDIRADISGTYDELFTN